MKQSNNRRQIKRLAKPGELNAIILPARRALDALRAETGFSSDDAISISIFASLAELIAKRKTRDSDAQAAARLRAPGTRQAIKPVEQSRRLHRLSLRALRLMFLS